MLSTIEVIYFIQKFRLIQNKMKSLKCAELPFLRYDYKFNLKKIKQNRGRISSNFHN
jgi:hypothetical protein